MTTVQDGQVVSMGYVLRIDGAVIDASAAGQPDVYRFEYAPPVATVGVVAIELPRGAVTVGGIGNDLGTWSYGIRTP